MCSVNEICSSMATRIWAGLPVLVVLASGTSRKLKTEAVVNFPLLKREGRAKVCVWPWHGQRPRFH